MRDTRNFKTKTQFKVAKNKKAEGTWEIGIDVGYSGVKAMSPNWDVRFPSYARRVDDTFTYAGEIPESSILYKDMENGELWLVGEKAQDITSDTDTTDSEQTLYGRDRYDSPLFKVIARAGMGACLRSNENGAPDFTTEHIVIQTGLPEKYMTDTSDIIDAFTGEHNFKLRIGSGEWEEFHLEIDRNHVYVMSQPKGTLFSLCISKEGDWTADARQYLGSSMIIFDPGFGTLDLFPILNGVVGSGETFPNLGMKRILQETTRTIKEKHCIDIPVSAMQKYLATGTVKHFDKKTFTTSEYEFGDYLSDASEKICNEALSKMVSILDLASYEYLVVTGGTGAAWYNKICSRLSGAKIKVIPGNATDKELPFVYSNVRGYYYYRLNKLAAGA